MKLLLVSVFFGLLLSFSLFAQTGGPTADLAAFAPAGTPQLSQDQIHDLIREAAEKDIENDKKQRDYTYIERENERKLDGDGQVKSSESRTYEIMVLYEEPVRKLIAKDDRSMSESDAIQEEEKNQKINEKRKRQR